MNNRRYVIGSLLLTLVLALAACSGYSPESPAKSPGPTPVTLRLLTWADDRYKQLYDMFHEQYPWITIEPVKVEANEKDITAKIKELQKAGTPADLAWIDGDLLAYEEKGLLENLKPYMDKDLSFQDKVLPDGYFDTMDFRGRRLAVPFVDVPMWIVVNKDLLAKHGVEMPPNSWTFDDFRSIAKQVTDPAQGEYGLTTSNEFVMRLLPLKAAADGHAANLAYLNEGMTQSLLDTPAVLGDVRWLADFVTEDGSMLSWSKAKEQHDVARNFMNGKTAFEVGGDWLLPRLKRDAKFNWDIMPFPRGKLNQYSFHIYGPLALLSGSEHKDEAYKWISFQFELEAQKWKIDEGANASIIDPELTDYIDKAPIWQGRNIEAVKMTKDNGLVLPGATIPGFSEYNWVNMVNEIVFNGYDIEHLIPETEVWNKRTLQLREQWKQQTSK
ncbi:ABC transporter substrate-binding protein [Paenibacillus sp. MMO-58]|uniref:ABC transporter substrate-binding protein n=1 Tax=Paenibacillus sp. MMO-58 TaxID=3081290 RepID=UPI003019E018